MQYLQVWRRRLYRISTVPARQWIYGTWCQIKRKDSGDWQVNMEIHGLLMVESNLFAFAS